MTTTERRTGLPVRTRIAATVALLVTAALAGAGLLVFVVESQRIEQQTVEEVEQELDEFGVLQRQGTDPTTGLPFASVSDLLRLFLERNVPDDDELLVAWVGSGPELRFPADDLLYADPRFLEATAPLVVEGGSTRIDTDRGPALITTQPVMQGDDTGALVVVKYLAEDRDELLDTVRTYAVVAFLSLLAVVALAAWQSGRLLAPLRALRSTAEEIGDSDLSRRVPVTGNDDITALSRTVNTMLDRLETAFRDQREFLDDAGHELRTPLTVLRGHLELLDPANPAEVDETRALLLDEVDRMARLVGDLILLAKSDRPDFVTLGEVDVAAMTQDVLAKARALGPRTWTLDGTAEATAQLDEQRVTQALLQLCDNAVKHTAEDDVVAIGSSLDGDRLRLWVRDTGPGVPPEVRDRVFDRFARGPVADDDEGFGLGLSIVAAITAAHGGRVDVEDAVPHGARFVVTLGRARPRPDVAVALEDTRPLRVEEPAWPAS